MVIELRLFNRTTAIALAVMLGIFIVTLSAMGRIPWCTCGFGLWTWQAWSSENSQMFGDPYSFSHILHGIIFYGILSLVARKIPVKWRLVIAIAVEIAWEIFENTPFIINRYRAATASLDYFGDSVLNSFGDVMFAMLGFWLASKLNWKWTLTIVVLIELVMLFTIRDNLTLNILMLIHPVKAIQQWQLAH